MKASKYVKAAAAALGISFNDVASSKGQSPERIQKNSQRIQSEAHKFARNLIKQATTLDDGHIADHDMVKLGPLKTVEAILRKVHNDYDGDHSKLADGCRLQILTDDARDDEKILALLEKEYKHAEKKHDSSGTQRKDSFKFNEKVRYLARRNEDGVKELVEFKDHASKPKKWGWMGTMVKLEINIGKGYYVPFEIQMFPKAMKEAYDESHKLYSQIKSDVEDWERYCEIHDTIKTAGDLERAIDSHSDTLNPQYREFQKDGKTDISTFFSCIRHKPPYNISPEHNQKVLDTLKKIMEIHKEAAQRCGLLKTKRFIDSGAKFPKLEDADASVKEIEIEPLEGYSQMRQNILIEYIIGPELLEQLTADDSYTQEDLIDLASQMRETQEQQQTNTPSNE